MSKKEKLAAGAAIAGGATVAGATILDDVDLGMSKGTATAEVNTAYREETSKTEAAEPEENDLDNEMAVNEADVEIEKTETDVDENLETETEEVMEDLEVLGDEVLPEAEVVDIKTDETETTDEDLALAEADSADLADESEAMEAVEAVEADETPEAAAVQETNGVETDAVNTQAEAEVKWTITDNDEPLTPEEELGEDVKDLIDVSCKVPEENTVEESDVTEDPDLLDEFIDKANDAVDDLLGSNDSSIPDFENNADVNGFL